MELICTKPDKTHALLKGAIEVWTRRYLWTPADAINFKPALCGNVYGDGRALFGLSTLNLRPAYYVIRGDSGWDCCDVSVDDLAASTRFYSTLFAAEPTVVKDDYVKWMLDDPLVKVLRTPEQEPVVLPPARRAAMAEMLLNSPGRFE
jgi:hypothetical protein